MLQMPRRHLAAGVVVLALFASACGSSPSPVAPTPTSPTPDVLAALDLAIQDEYRAEATYQGVVNDFGAVLPFAAIITAELRHSTAIAQLFTKRGLAVPASQSSVDTVPHFPSVRDACVAGANAERDNIAMYDRLLLQALPDDVRQVFTNNRRASLDNHLPAFTACS